MRRLLPEVSLFLGGGVLVALTLRLAVPALARAGIDPFGAWMLLSPGLVFLPLVVAARALLRAEGSTAPGRLRLDAPARGAWASTALGALAIALASLALNAVAERLRLPVSPFVREPGPWAPWMFLAWLAYWPLNILGEEYAWRGVVLPRMERVLGAAAWPLNGALWGLFHTAFGPGNLLVLLPTLVVVPLMAQRTRSTWVAVALHAFVSFPGMVLLALGKV